MGNRANVIFVTGDGGMRPREISPAIYLHWNGGPESVYAFLAELDRRNVRADAEYEAARFVHVVGDFFDSDLGPRSWTPGECQEYEGLSLGIINGPKEITPEALANLRTDNGDNGFYVVDRSGDGLKMRRFTMERTDYEGDDWSKQYELREWPLEKVEHERAVAEDAEHAEAFKAIYDRLLLTRQTVESLHKQHG
jgi:hypothetical protein